MHRTRGFLAALIGAGALMGRPAAAQQRSDHPYTVAEHEGRGRDESRVRIPAGTAIAVTLDEDIPIDRDRFGDTFDGHVKRNVMVGGEVAIPAGAPAKVKLVESSQKRDAATVRLADVRVKGKLREVSVGDARADTDPSGLSTGEKTAVGAAAGAIVGAVSGAGVLEGAVVGAGGGLAWGLLSDRGRKIEDGTTLRFELERKLEVK